MAAGVRVKSSNDEAMVLARFLCRSTGLLDTLTRLMHIQVDAYMLTLLDSYVSNNSSDGLHFSLIIACEEGGENTSHMEKRDVRHGKLTDQCISRNLGDRHIVPRSHSAQRYPYTKVEGLQIGRGLDRPTSRLC